MINYNKDVLNKYHMRSALNEASMSKSKKRKVGCVIVKDGRIISSGRNGTISGTSNVCEYRVVTCDNCNYELLIDDCDVVNNVITIKRVTSPYVLGSDFYVSIGGEITDDIAVRVACSVCSVDDAYHYIEYSKEEWNKLKLKAKPTVLHAEENAITFAAKKGISIEGCSMYTTTAPCITCARMITSSGIKEVFYLQDYKNKYGVNFLNDLNIVCSKIDMCEDDININI